jgi:hypothetical protein
MIAQELALLARCVAVVLAAAALGASAETPNGSKSPKGSQAVKPEKPAEPQTRELRILQKVMPTYDRTGVSADGGCVTVRFQIKHDGFVGDITVLEAKPETLAEPTIEALKQWQFQSFPPPDLYTTQTFNFAPELMRLPDNAIRSPYATLSDEGLKSTACGAGKPAVTQGKR